VDTINSAWYIELDGTNVGLVSDERVIFARTNNAFGNKTVAGDRVDYRGGIGANWSILVLGN